LRATGLGATMPSPVTRRRRLAAVLVACALAGCGRGDLSSPDPGRRAAAVRALGEHRRDADLTALLVAQRDGSAEVRLAAAEAFAARGDAAAADALGRMLADPDPAVVTAAAGGLAALPNLPRAREDLLRAYVDASPAGRAAVANALETLGTSMREAVESEARQLWDRNVVALAAPGPGRAGAAEELGASGRAEAVARLLPLVDPNRNPDADLAAGAARGLGDAGDWSARPHLEAMLSEADPRLVEAAAAALGRLGDPAAANALAIAGSAGSGRVAGVATDALAALPDAPDVGLALCEVAARAPDATVAARAARQARRRDAACPVRPLLARTYGVGAEAAVAVLGELAPAGPDAEAVVARLVPLLDPSRGDAAIRLAAIRALGRLRPPAAAGPVKDRAAALAARVAEARARWVPGGLAAAPASGFDRPDGRLAAVLSRGAPLAAAPRASTTPEWLDAVPPAAAAELGALLATAGHLRSPGAQPLLAAALSDPLPAVRAGAVEGLAALGGEDGRAAAVKALDDREPEVRAAGAAALGRLGARGAGPLAAAATRGLEDPAWAVTLARALGEADAPEAVPALAALLDGPAAAVAASALARLGTRESVQALVDHVSRPGATPRLEPVEALAQLAPREGADVLEALLTSERPELRAAAARAMGRLRHEAASARLEALRSDYYGRVRRAAVEALAKLPAGAPRPRP
jgi:HEAT repeat protein